MADAEERSMPTLDSEVSCSSDVRQSISEDPWELINDTARKSICMERRKSRRKSLRDSIFLDPWEIIDEVDDSDKWAGTV